MNEESVEQRIPPHDVEAEGAVLSAVMVDSDAYAKVADFLVPEHFYSEAHRRMFEACGALVAESKPLDVVHVAAWLRDRERLSQVGGMAYLTEVLNSAPAVANVRAYAMRVHELWRLRQVLQNAIRITAQVYGGIAEPQEFCQQTAEAFHEYAVAPGASGGLVQVGGVMRDVVARLHEAERSGKSLLGSPTGITRYDRLTGGLHDSDQTIIAARPGDGKTSLALQWALWIAITVGPVAFFSLEMPRDQLVMRLACNEGRVDVQRMRIGQLNPQDWRNLTTAQRVVESLPLYIDDTEAITLGAMRSRLRRWQLDLEKGKPGKDGRPHRIRLVVVDYLQLMTASSTAQRHGTEKEVSENSAGLKGLAKSIRAPFVTLSQMNRGIEDGDRKPRLRDLRSSGAIEQDADNVVFIHPHKKEQNVKELIIAKQRNGPKDTVLVRFDAQYTRFDNLADGEYEQHDDEDHGPLADPRGGR